MIFVLGLTGSIGMGKSATAGLFRESGVPVHDADASVHALYRGAALPLIAAAFPSAIADGAVDRTVLGALVLDRPDALRRLEAIVHPLVREEENAFLERIGRAGCRLAVLDVPLLLETGGEARCDALLVVTASPEIQRERVLSRPGMTPERFRFILDKQIPDAQKRRRAHFLVDTGRGFPSARAQVRGILTCLAGRSGRGSRDARMQETGMQENEMREAGMHEAEMREARDHVA